MILLDIIGPLATSTVPVRVVEQSGPSGWELGAQVAGVVGGLVAVGAFLLSLALYRRNRQHEEQDLLRRLAAELAELVNVWPHLHPNALDLRAHKARVRALLGGRDLPAVRQVVSGDHEHVVRLPEEPELRAAEAEVAAALGYAPPGRGR